MMTKLCKTCGVKKPLEEMTKDSKSQDGRRHKCKSCHSNYMVEYYYNNPDKTKEKNRINSKTRPAWKRHHISEDKFNELMKRYGGMCHACKTRKATVVDHDHSCCPYKSGSRSCGECVRGLLCHWCNSALGHVKDDRNILLSMVDYLDSYKDMAH